MTQPKKSILRTLRDSKKPEMIKKYIFNNIDEFDLKEKDMYGIGILVNIIFDDCYRIFKFTKEEILILLDKLDLKQVDIYGYNILMCIVVYMLGSNELSFTKDDILFMLDKFDLTQKTYKQMIFSKNNLVLKKDTSIYDLIKYKENMKIISFYNEDLSILVSKLDIEMEDSCGDNILIKELKNGLNFNSNDLVQKILNTENEKIINCVYEHINQIKWEEKDLLKFLKKNELKISENVFSII